MLDPMSGSGTVLRAAAEHGLQAIGYDVDPLAVLQARVWTTPLDEEALVIAGDDLADRAAKITLDHVKLPWMDTDEETQAFVQFWYGKRQRDDLRRLSFVLSQQQDAIGDALRIAMSRLIITKVRGASLAADVSHSRPHRVYSPEEYQYDVFEQFRRSVRYVASRLQSSTIVGQVDVRAGDSRDLHHQASESVTSIVTSPPYLNAIDYLRGHRLSLVWLGYRLDELRAIRSGSIGAERAPDSGSNVELAQLLTEQIDPEGKLEKRRRNMVVRYAQDMSMFMAEAYRVLQDGGEMVLVVGDSTHRGVFVDNTAVVRQAALHVGFTVDEKRTRRRKLPPSKRYLPPPTSREESALGQRMRMETVLTLVKS